MTGEDKFKQMGERIKEEKMKNEEKENNELATAVSSLSAISENKELASMYARSASVGSENLSGDMPLLKIHSTGKSKNELIDGSEPNNGWFFYKPTKDQFESVICHILAISKGHSVPKVAGNPGETTYQHLLSGVFMQNGEYVPFMFFLNSAGHRNRMYDFGKKVHQYTHQRPFGIPMFALTIKLFTTQEKYSFTTQDGKKMDGKAWVLDYEILKSEDGTPVLVDNVQEFSYLEDKALKAKEMMDTLIKTEANEDTIQQATVVEDPEFLNTAESLFAGNNNEF